MASKRISLAQLPTQYRRTDDTEFLARPEVRQAIADAVREHLRRTARRRVREAERKAEDAAFVDMLVREGAPGMARMTEAEFRQALHGLLTGGGR